MLIIVLVQEFVLQNVLLTPLNLEMLLEELIYVLQFVVLVYLEILLEIDYVQILVQEFTMLKMIAQDFV
jgi:hypothetical protein